MNGIVIVLYLMLHFALFSRPESQSWYALLGILFPIACNVGIIVAIISLIIAGGSICNEGRVATSVFVSSIVIILNNIAV